MVEQAHGIAANTGAIPDTRCLPPLPIPDIEIPIELFIPDIPALILKYLNINIPIPPLPKIPFIDLCPLPDLEPSDEDFPGFPEVPDVPDVPETPSTPGLPTGLP